MTRGTDRLSSTAQVKKLARPAAAIAMAAASAIGGARRVLLGSRAAMPGHKLPGGTMSFGKLAIIRSRDSCWRSFMISPVPKLNSVADAHDAAELCKFLPQCPARSRLPHG